METTAFLVLSVILLDTAHTCSTASSNFSMVANFQNAGFYCSTQSLSSSKTPLHHCKLNCIESVKCTAVNYNRSDGICTALSTPCVIADEAPVMMYFIFNNRVQRHCFNWIKQNKLTKQHSRYVYDIIGVVKVARILYKTGFYPAHLRNDICYTGTGTTRLHSRNKVCEVLVLSPSCTATWAPYEARQPIPAGAETAGLTVEGEATYPVMFAPEGNPGQYRIGYYTVVNGYGTVTLNSAHHYATKMKILILLWWGILITAVHSI